MVSDIYTSFTHVRLTRLWIWVPVKSVTNHIGDKSNRWQSTRWRQIGDRCQSVRRQS